MPALQLTSITGTGKPIAETINAASQHRSAIICRAKKDPNGRGKCGNTHSHARYDAAH
jgi:hypothetical protein